MATQKLYHELHRPQFHFTPKKNWTNDPNGLVYYKGEYHLFFQHNPQSVHWGNMTWGHAVSPDLVHWEQLDHAIHPDELGTIYSGSAVVDWNNTAGLQSGGEKPIVCIYTSAGSHAPVERPFTQSIAYSNDRGRSWAKYAHNPVLGHIRANNRDPKVIRHEPTGKWVMALFLDGNDFALFGSPNLTEWQHLSDVRVDETAECPDLFELPVDGEPNCTKWIFWGGAGVYRIGSFDGTTFTAETPSLRADLGANGYTAQTWSDIPPQDGRRIQISWMAGGKYPAMPFNGQMSFPVELTLRRLPQGLRLCRRPVREIARLHGRAHTWQDEALRPGHNLIPRTDHDLFDVRAEIEPRGPSTFGVLVRGIPLEYDAAGGVRFLGQSAELKGRDGRVRLQLLIDRTSLEVFGNDGEVSMSFCFLPEACDHNLEFSATGGEVTLRSLVVQELHSAWA